MGGTTARRRLVAESWARARARRLAPDHVEPGVPLERDLLEDVRRSHPLAAALPGAAALFSPATDLAGTGRSLRSNSRRDAMFRGDVLHHVAAAYLNGADPRTPLASPLYGDLAGLPPMLIHVGEREILRDDSTRLAERAREAGVMIELEVWPVVPHVWQFAHAMVPEARRSLTAAAAFLHGQAR